MTRSGASPAPTRRPARRSRSLPSTARRCGGRRPARCDPDMNGSEAPHGLGHPHDHEVLGVHVPDKLYSLGEEIAHASTHGLGIVLSIVGLTVLVARASMYGNAWHVTAVSIFGA